MFGDNGGDDTDGNTAKIECPHCGTMVHAYSINKESNKTLVTTTSGLVLAGVGGFVGTSIGIATGGVGIPATVPMGVVGAVVGAGAGHVVGEQLEETYCPSCEGEIDISVD